MIPLDCHIIIPEPFARWTPCYLATRGPFGFVILGALERYTGRSGGRLYFRLRPPIGGEVNYLILNLLMTLTLCAIMVENMSRPHIFGYLIT